MSNIGQIAPIFLFCLTPILILPVIIGYQIITRAPDGDEFLRYVGWLTVKPLFTTPFWLFALTQANSLAPASLSDILPTAIASILPGAILTIIIAARFRSALFGAEVRRSAWLLLVLDCVRWINSGVLMASPQFDRTQPFFDQLQAFMSITGILLPTIFAFIALGISWDEIRNVKRKRKNDDYPVDEWAN